MATMKQRFGLLTFGTLLGAGIGLSLATYGLSVIRAGTVHRSVDSVVFIAFGAAVLGGGLGLFAEYLIRHPAVADRTWVRHLI